MVKYRIVKIFGYNGRILRELRVYENQKKVLMICPKCKEKFYYWQDASKHSEELKHYGDYNAKLFVKEKENKK